MKDVFSSSGWRSMAPLIFSVVAIISTQATAADPQAFLVANLNVGGITLVNQSSVTRTEDGISAVTLFIPLKDRLNRPVAGVYSLVEEHFNCFTRTNSRRSARYFDIDGRQIGSKIIIEDKPLVVLPGTAGAEILEAICKQKKPTKSHPIITGTPPIVAAKIRSQLKLPDSPNTNAH